MDQRRSICHGIGPRFSESARFYPANIRRVHATIVVFRVFSVVGRGKDCILTTTPARLELLFENGPLAGDRVEVTESPFVVGRDRAAQLFLDDPSVSRIHAALIFRDDQWILQDLGGVNPFCAAYPPGAATPSPLRPLRLRGRRAERTVGVNQWLELPVPRRCQWLWGSGGG